MHHLMRFALSLAALFVVFDANAEVVLGQTAPTLITQELNGQYFDLTAMKGKVVILHYWATWCAPCREEMPVLDAFYQQYHARGVEVLAISLDRAHNRDKVKDMMQSFHFPAALMSDADTNQLGEPSSLPVTYIIDQAGTVRAILTPDQAKLTTQSLADAVTPLLKP